ncbi:sensor histidine kinase [Konateibacter massiliensis]|uniref:sensor histidine kinase n=1 Tax=Konateibacter massiliensis TaxID=2002841 RepID=UPI000C1625D8|nr:HAMP domain-containing sensor histidine kinase [Konateibacter massiliensis]
MKKIVYSSVTKVLAFILMEILVIVSLALTYYIGTSAVNFTSLREGIEGKAYYESRMFEQLLTDKLETVNYFLQCQQDFETDGEFDGNKEVTLSQFLSNSEDATEYSITHLYNLQELINWGTNGVETATVFEILKNRMIAGDIKLSDMEYYAFTKEMLQETDAYVAETDFGELTEEQIRAILVGGIQGRGLNISEDMLDASIVREAYGPNNTETPVLDFFFEKGDFSELEKTSQELEEALHTIASEYSSYQAYENDFKVLDSSNFKIYVQDSDGNVLLNNAVAESSAYEAYFNSSDMMGVVYDAANKELHFSSYAWGNIYMSMFKVYGQSDYIYAIGVDTTFAHEDEFSRAHDSYYSILNSVISLAACVFGALVCIAYLMAVCGRKAGENEICLSGFDRIKTEIAAGIMLALGAADLYFMNEMQYGMADDIWLITGIGIGFGLFSLGFLSLVKRIKAGQLWKNSLLYGICYWSVVFFRNRKVTTKIAVIYAGYLIVSFGLLFIAFGEYSVFFVALWFLFSAFAGFLLLREAVARQSILNGIEKISSGDLEYKIDTRSLSGSNQVLADAVNNIGEGLHNAVDASVRNERLKTDLITNVSHDIKTPLTSIINYVDLIKRENIEDEKIRGYIEILDNKSQRLKNLTEDLVEASKISSGNIKLEMVKIDFVELLNQTEGEFSEKFESKGLQILKTIPEEHVWIMADGRRIWRVVENLYNNVAKYAMPNTRVYVDVKADEVNVVFSIKNISENPLNINADELTERFIRGDVSRSTEGSGLGLSIAKNLTNLQKGEFEIYLDGDLFRVTIVFPRVE